MTLLTLTVDTDKYPHLNETYIEGILNEVREFLDIQERNGKYFKPECKEIKLIRTGPVLQGNRVSALKVIRKILRVDYDISKALLEKEIMIENGYEELVNEMFHELSPFVPLKIVRTSDQETFKPEGLFEYHGAYA